MQDGNLRNDEMRIRYDLEMWSRRSMSDRNSVLTVARENAVVSTFVQAWRGGAIDWEGALTRTVIELARQNAELLKNATKSIERTAKFNFECASFDFNAWEEKIRADERKKILSEQDNANG
jgi:hypothetical protein